MRKNLRYMILLAILLFVAVNEALIKMRSTSWENPLWVRIYAVSGDGRAATDAYIDSLTSERFKPIEKFVNREARRFHDMGFRVLATLVIPDRKDVKLVHVLH